MKLGTAALGSMAYFAGYQWDIIPDTAASIAVIVAFYIVVRDIWSDPMPTQTQKVQLERLAEKVEPRLDLSSVDAIMTQIAARPSEIDPEVLLSELLKEDDETWLKEQVEVIVRP